MPRLTLFPRIALTGLALLLLFTLFVVFRSPHYRVERAIQVTATSRAIFDEVNDFNRWKAWYPLSTIDSSARITVSGAPQGEGAIFVWSGNDTVGAGRMEIAESRMGSLIRIQTTYSRPLAGHSVSTFTFKPENDTTQVTWSIEGRHGFLAKALGVFVDVDEILGPQLETALRGLQSQVNGASRSR